MAIWRGRAEDDGYNRLVMRPVSLARCRRCCAPCRATCGRPASGSPKTTCGRTLNNYSAIAASSSSCSICASTRTHERRTAIAGAERLEGESLCSFGRGRQSRRRPDPAAVQECDQSMLRTNFYQLDQGGQPKPTFAFKIDPQDRRAAAAASVPRDLRLQPAGGRRASALRHGCARRPALVGPAAGLPHRSAGPGQGAAGEERGDRSGRRQGRLRAEAIAGRRRPRGLFKEGTESYKIFICAARRHRQSGWRHDPAAGRVVRFDGDDPYLVVAADKGTATFSDTANAISEGRNFWLGDAFASGGSAGYDHKKMGITARGAWEAVKRHFREMNRDIQTEPFTAAGVGDMSGDVFGNGMLLSKATAWSPPSTTATSSSTRIRIRQPPGKSASACSTWAARPGRTTTRADFKGRRHLLAAAEVDRAVARNPAPCSISTRQGDAAGSHDGDPQDERRPALVRRHRHLYPRDDETDADAGDRANDQIRDHRAGTWRQGDRRRRQSRPDPARADRIQPRGGRCNSDAIDNSAGVNSSDMEVNIKIALGAAVKAGNTRRSSSAMNCLPR
jgi:glutamate dehydrogenase